MLRFMMVACALSLIPAASRADIVRAVNAARAHECRAPAAPASALREDARLDEAARRLSAGDALENALRKAGYRAVTSASVQITNVSDDRDIERIVGQRFCQQVGGHGLRDIGAFRRGADIWLLVAAPFAPPGPADRQRISRRILELTNQARSQARRCGAELFSPAPPLTLDPVLERAALAHSRDMATHDYMDHTGRDGSSPAERVTRTGYRWQAIGENLASGVVTPEEAVQGWVGSPHHCRNLMDPRFTQMGAAFAVNESSAGGIYWTQVFGTPH